MVLGYQAIDLHVLITLFRKTNQRCKYKIEKFDEIFHDFNLRGSYFRIDSYPSSRINIYVRFGNKF